MLPLEALDDEDYVGSVGGIGAPVVGIEKIKQGQECLRALRGVEEAVGSRCRALISAEIGGSNSIEPMITASYAGMPVVDGDGMGRAFPEVQMSTFFIYGLEASPGAIADDKGNVVVFKDSRRHVLAGALRPPCRGRHGRGRGLRDAPMRGRLSSRRSPCRDTLDAGARDRRARSSTRAPSAQDVIDRLLEETGATLFFTGKVADVRRELRGGFAMGEARLDGPRRHAGPEARIAIQNENLVLWVDGEPKAIVPDLIMNLELETGEPITTEMLRYGQQLAVIGIPAHELMKTERAPGGRRPQGVRLSRNRLSPAGFRPYQGEREMTELKLIRMIDAADLEDIAIGGAILGTGGGGDPYIGKLMAQGAIRRHGKVRLVDVDSFADDALIAPVCMMGAPTVMTEKLPQGDEIVVALRKLEKVLGRPVDAVLCGEAGGLNSTTPFVAAAATGLPLIDGDGMGRAFPELQMTTFGMHGVSATPMALSDDKGNSVVLETISNQWTERLARSCTVDMGGSALLAFYPMTGAQAKASVGAGHAQPMRRSGADLARGARAARRSHRGGSRRARRQDHLRRAGQGRAEAHRRRLRPRRRAYRGPRGA